MLVVLLFAQITMQHLIKCQTTYLIENFNKYYTTRVFKELIFQTDVFSEHHYKKTLLF